jgi:hypothetical protein
VVSESIEQGRRELLVTGEDLHPLGKREVGRDDDAASLVAFGEQVEEELAADAIEGDEAEFVELCGAPHKSTHVERLVM